jgi:1-deoxy-D-xylulose-5-phosphate synthase
MILHDVSLQNLHVVFCVDRAGIVGNDGETHNGVFDLAYLSTIPGMTVLSPASFAELEAMLKTAVYEIQGPVAIRYPRGSEGEYKEEKPGEEVLLRQGDDVTIVTYGRLTNQCLAAALLLEKKGIQAELIKLGQLHPLQCEQVMRSLKKTGRLLTAEDVCREGCIGEKLLVQAQLRGMSLKKAVLLNTGDGILPHGSIPELLCSLGLDSESIADKAWNMVHAYE